jgi:hypothetical protein
MAQKEAIALVCHVQLQVSSTPLPVGRLLIPASSIGLDCAGRARLRLLACSEWQMGAGTGEAVQRCSTWVKATTAVAAASGFSALRQFVNFAKGREAFSSFFLF